MTTGWNGGQPPAFSRPPSRPGLAVAALVCGIVGIPLFFIGILSLLGVIFGLITARKVKRSNGTLTGLGMARAGWILGVLGLIGFAAFVWAGATGRLDDENDNGVFDSDENELELGECLETLPEGEIVFTYDVIDCDLPHIGEVYLVEDLAEFDGEDFPGEDEAVLRSEKVCLDSFERFIGRSYGTSEFEVFYLYPREVAWKIDSNAVCVVHSVNGTVTGTLEDADR
jgi:hypothetical protein